MYTDPARTTAGVPGTVEGNPVFVYHDAFNDRPAEVAELKERYRAGKVGDAEVKERLAAALNRFLDPMRERRAALEADRGLVEELIVTGAAHPPRGEAHACGRAGDHGAHRGAGGYRRAARSRHSGVRDRG